MMANEGRPAGNGAAEEENLMSNPSVSHSTGALAQISTSHADELAASAIPLDVALACDVYTARSRNDLPPWAQWIADRHGSAVFPALVYPMSEQDGVSTGQVKPATGRVSSEDGRLLKYISPGRNDNPPKLPVLRHVNSPRIVLIVEGVKQALAALAWAPYDWSVYRIAGIWSWSVGDPEAGGSPTPHLAAVQGANVVVVPDADASTNINVFDGATALGEACQSYGATSVMFSRLPAGGKDGLDDFLAWLKDDEARRQFLVTMVKAAKSRPADLDAGTRKRMRKERLQKASAEGEAEQATANGLVRVNLAQAPRTVSLALVDALYLRSGGTRLFRRETELVRLRRDDQGALISSFMNSSALHRELLDAVYPVRPNADGGGMAASAVPQDQLGLVSDHADRFPRLNGITRAPIVRRDGTVVVASGYDEATGLYLDLSPDLADIDIPDMPTEADIREAASLIRDDLLAMDGANGFDGFVFESNVDQTNAAAALITTVVRAWTGPAPLFLVDGIQPGVGKGQLADAIHHTAFGTPMPFQPAPRANDEMDKRITAELAAGVSSICLDEVQDQSGTCRLDHSSLRAALTAEVYGSRRLGESEMLKLPQLATWFALGNNVRVPGDMSRRVVHIRLSSERTDLDTRGHFRHSLSQWVPENRVRLLRAVLVLVRAWFANDQPLAPKPFHFASFSEWQRIVGGILHLAGFEGFLGNVLESRKLSNDLVVDWKEHLEWLESAFGRSPFSASDAMTLARADDDAAPPYGRNFGDLDPQALSKLWGQNPRWFDDYRIKHQGKVHGGKKAYVIERAPDTHASVDSPAELNDAPDQGQETASALEAITTQDPSGFTRQVARVSPRLSGPTIKELER